MSRFRGTNAASNERCCRQWHHALKHFPSTRERHNDRKWSKREPCTSTFRFEWHHVDGSAGFSETIRCDRPAGHIEAGETVHTGHARRRTPGGMRQEYVWRAD
jgi:ribonuclease HI